MCTADHSAISQMKREVNNSHLVGLKDDLNLVTRNEEGEEQLVIPGWQHFSGGKTTKTKRVTTGKMQ